jgi:hypothetical protein
MIIEVLVKIFEKVETLEGSMYKVQQLSTLCFTQQRYAHRVMSTCEHSSHKTTIIVFYLISQLHVSAFVTSAIIRLEYNYQRNYIIQCDII